LLMMHAAERVRLEWVERRSHSAWLLWEHHAECAARLEQLMVVSSTRTADKAAPPVRVLLVDDTRTVRETFRRLLSERDYDVDVAANMTEALAKTATQFFDIAIVDYFMPGGNGDELCRALREDP